MAISLAEKPVYARTCNIGFNTLNAATAGSMGSTSQAVTVYTAGANGGRIESLLFNTDDTAAVNVFVMLVDGSSNVYPLGIVNVPLSSGNSSSVANIDALAGTGVSLLGLRIDNITGKRIIPIMPSWTLRISCLANMTAAKKLWATVVIFEFSDSVG